MENKFVGHHTCSNRGGREKILKEAPFYARSKTFLGKGYYFWDDNLIQARHWGKVHYSNCYCILEAEICGDENEVLDLVGSRQDMKHLIELGEQFRKKLGSSWNNWTLGYLIEYLKRLNRKKEYRGIFEFKVFRAIDLSKASSKEKPVKFVKDRESYFLLNPQIIICSTEKNTPYLREKRILEEK